MNEIRSVMSEIWQRKGKSLQTDHRRRTTDHGWTPPPWQELTEELKMVEYILLGDTRPGFWAQMSISRDTVLRNDLGKDTIF